MKTVILPETGFGGHRLVYLRALAQEALRQEMGVVLAIPRSVVQSDSYRVHFGELDSHVRVELIPEGLYPDPSTLLKIAKRHPDSGVLVLHGDAYAARAARWGRSKTPFVLLIMRDPKGEVVTLRRRLRNVVKQTLIGAAQSMRGYRVVWLSQHGDQVETSRVEVVDPFIHAGGLESLRSEADLYRRSVLPPGTERWVVMAGALSRRKNVDLVAQSLAQLNGDGHRFGLLLVGPIAPDLAESERHLKERLPANVPVVIDGGVKSNEDITVAVAAADVSVTAYSIHYPNSTMLKALVVGTPAVVAGTSFMRRRVAKLPFVETADLVRQEIADAVLRASTLPKRAPDTALAQEVGVDSFSRDLIDQLRAQ